MYSSKLIFLIALFFLVNCFHAEPVVDIDFTSKVNSPVEKVQLNEEEVPLSMRGLQLSERHGDHEHDKSNGTCKKYDCDKKKVCEPYKCDCALKKYECHCKDVPYKCCWPVSYPCNCYEEKYACKCAEQKYNCKCEKKPYNCNCTVHKTLCNCKTIKYECGYLPSHDHGPYGDHDHDKKSVHSVLDNIVQRKNYHHQHVKYCYKKICDVCEEEKCDTCYEWKCKKCLKQVCDTCTKQKCLGKCWKQECGTCTDKVCQTCTTSHCKVCKKCQKVLSGCEFFLVKCDHSHKDSH